MAIEDKNENIGFYEPTEQEIIDCTENNISCDFGICQECIIGSERRD